jgi:hypothetical protein
MKKILILGLLLSAGINTFAQQKHKTDYMIITVDDNGTKMNMVVTRTDSAQLQQHLDLSLKHVKARDYTATYDSIMLSMLNRYFNRGWKLVSTSEETAGGTFPSAYKYYLSKEK